MKHSTNFLKAAALLCALQFTSCSKDETMTINTTDVYNGSNGTTILGKAVSASLNNVQIRRFIKQQALLKFDGDYDILYSNIKDKKLENGRTIREELAYQYLKLSHKEENAANTEESLSTIDKITSDIEHCQFSVPALCEEWDTEKFIPKVVALPIRFDDQKDLIVPMYDKDGKKTDLKIRDEITETLVVIGTCERVDRQGKVIPEYLINQAVVAGRGVYGDNQYLQRYQIRDLPAIEPGISGGPEMRVVYVSLANPTGELYNNSPVYADIHDEKWNPSRDATKNQKWASRNSLMFNNTVTFNGNNPNNGTLIAYWVEEDPSDHSRRIEQATINGQTYYFRSSTTSGPGGADEYMGSAFTNVLNETICDNGGLAPYYTSNYGFSGVNWHEGGNCTY
ncbi:hypothetical protein [Hymenobacter rubripertinctus]|uniref:hypothetical protein n=1 Tax=Hymenobacter rubripertinctus TaxID=2029981 RepID=UPI0011C48A39|nr:hypothetical protein [Hymenobacter rubripertinctus]